MLKVFRASIIAIALLHLFFLFNGVTSFITTVLFYYLTGLGSIGLLRKIEIKKKISLQGIRLLVISSIVSLLFLEFSIRYILHRHLTYHERTGQFFSNTVGNGEKYTDMVQDRLQTVYAPGTDIVVSNKDFSFIHSINSLGLRGPEPVNEKNDFQFIALGDSYTEGVGTSNDSTWPHLLKEKLSARLSTPVHYINAGCSGTDAFTMYYSLTWLMQRYQPDLVILCINSSDFFEYINRSGELKGRHPIGEKFYALSYIFRVIVHDLLHLDQTLRTKEEIRWDERKAEQAIADVIIRQYQSILSVTQTPLLVVATPSQWELENNERKFQLIQQALDKNNVPFIDLFSDYQQLIREKDLRLKDLYWQSDGHFNPKGYQYAASFILNHINKSIAITAPRSLPADL